MIGLVGFVSFFAGVLFGVFIMALMAVAADEKDKL